MKVWRDFYPVPRVKGVEETRKVAKESKRMFRSCRSRWRGTPRISSLFFRSKYFVCENVSVARNNCHVSRGKSSYFEVSSIGIAFLEFFYEKLTIRKNISVVRILRKTGNRSNIFLQITFFFFLLFDKFQRETKKKEEYWALMQNVTLFGDKFSPS